MYDIIVIGGGASGLMAAISAKRQTPRLSVALLERADRVGKKLAVTGNGQCNITNIHPRRENYHGAVDFAMDIIERFPPEKQCEFFFDIGITVTVRENGKAYPYSLQASSVVDALRFAACEQGVTLITDKTVRSVSKRNGIFELVCSDGSFSSKSVIVACGGAAGGKLGSYDGYSILKNFSHTVTALRPSIVQLRSELPCLKALKGIKVPARLSGGNITTDIGDLLFCDYGISGPGVLTLSSHYKEGSAFTVCADLVPTLSEAETLGILRGKREKLPSRPAEELLSGLLHRRLGITLVKYCGISPAALIGTLSDQALENINSVIHSLTFPITATTGFANAQVTAGGAVADEFTADSLRSKKTDGLFAAGEVLDVDGECGGYNLCFAWASGYVAGVGAAKYIGDTK